MWMEKKRGGGRKIRKIWTRVKEQSLFLFFQWIWLMNRLISWLTVNCIRFWQWLEFPYRLAEVRLWVGCYWWKDTFFYISSSDWSPFSNTYLNISKRDKGRKGRKRKRKKGKERKGRERNQTAGVKARISRDPARHLCLCPAPIS